MEQGGVAGVHGHADAEALLARISAGLAHRGAGVQSLAEGARALSSVSDRGLAEGWARLERTRLAIDGALVDAEALDAELARRGALRRGEGEAERLLQLIARSGQSTAVNRLLEALGAARGGWALLMMTEGLTVAARDPNGLRPLAMGRLGQAVLFASETGALRGVGASAVRPLSPGELVIVDDSGVSTIRPFPAGGRRGCLMESLELARVDAELDVGEVWGWRAARGERLATQEPVSADGVVPLRAGDAPLALGYARVSALPVLPLLAAGCAPPSATAGRALVLVCGPSASDHALAASVAALHAAGASAVHVRRSAPPPLAACPYGVALRAPSALGDSPQRARATLGAESVAWLSARAPTPLGSSERAPPCDACFSREFPILPRLDGAEQQLPLFQGAEPGAV